MDKQILLLCKKTGIYRGVDRSVSFSSKAFNVNIIKDLLELVDDNGDIIYTRGSLATLKNVQKALYASNYQTDIIIITEAYDADPLGDKFRFLGYDITGDSDSSSLISSAFFEVSDYYEQESIQRHQHNLNDSGLFLKESEANAFLLDVKRTADWLENNDRVRLVKVWSVE